MTAEELWNRFKNMNNPNDIFEIYDEAMKLSETEKEKLIQLGAGDSIDMKYITAVEMRKNGTWDNYLKEWEENKNKSASEQLQEYMESRKLSFPKH